MTDSNEMEGCVQKILLNYLYMSGGEDDDTRCIYHVIMFVSRSRSGSRQRN